MKKKQFIMLGAVVALAVSMPGCIGKTKDTPKETVQQEETGKNGTGKEENPEQAVVKNESDMQKETETVQTEADSSEAAKEEMVMDENAPDIYYDFESIADNTFVPNLGTKEDAAAELINGASCVKEEESGGILSLSGGTSSRTSPYLSIPTGTFDNVSELTLSANVRISGSADNYYLFLIGNSNVRHFAVSMDRNSLKTSFCAQSGAKEKSSVVEFSEDRTGQWVHITVLVKNTATDYVAETYVDGELAGSFSFDGYALVDVGKEEECSIGKPIMGSSYLEGAIADFRVWFRAMETEEAQLLYSEQNMYRSEQFEKSLKTMMLGQNASARHVIFPLSFPETLNGCRIQWKIKAEDGCVKKTGELYSAKKKAKKAVITAAYAGKKVKFTVTVQPQKKRNQIMLFTAAASFEIPNPDNIRGNITLPDKVMLDEKKISIRWKSGNPELVTDTDQGKMKKGVVTRQNTEKRVTLTAVFKYKGNEYTKTYELQIKAAPEEKEYSAYLYTYFRGNIYGNGESQHIHMAVSHDGFFWEALNDNEPVLKAQKGTKGVRDSFIIRSPEGDRFYIIGTDLDANGGDWASYGGNGSRYIRVWESDDLIHWSEERLIDIAPKYAACMWAPECTYDVATGEYVVYFSSGLKTPDGGKRIYYVKTRDFYTFTEPQIYKNKDGGITYIDTTMAVYDGVYYRFTKRENDNSIFLETSSSLLGEYTLVRDKIHGEEGVEGPACFRINGEEKWILMMDGYTGPNTGVGYFPLVAESPDDLKKGIFRRLDRGEYQMPEGAKHGSFMPVTQEEYDALLENFMTEETTGGAEK